MNNAKQKFLEKASEAVKKIAVAEMDKWPPDCVGPFFQPERPAMPTEDSEEGSD